LSLLSVFLMWLFRLWLVCKCFGGWHWRCHFLAKNLNKEPWKSDAQVRTDLCYDNKVISTNSALFLKNKRAMLGWCKCQSSSLWTVTESALNEHTKQNAFLLLTRMCVWKTHGTFNNNSSRTTNQKNNTKQ
jgi:hypothetical protein